MHKTTTGGNNWNNIGTINAYRVIFQDDLTGLAYGSNQILKTTDGGVNWNTVLNQSSTRYVSGLSMLDANNGFACSMNFYDSITVYSTSNGGNSWNFVSNDVNNAYDCANLYFIDANTGFISNFWGDLFKTSDGGLNWNYVFTASGLISEIVFTSASTGYGVAQTEFIKTTDGGVNWTTSMPPFSPLYNALKVTPNGTMHLVGGDGLNTGTLIKSINNGNTWTQTGTSTQQFYGLDFVNDTLGFTCGTNGQIMRFGSGSVGIDKYSEENISIFPNPTNDLINISNDKLVINEIKIYDNSGRLILYEKKCNASIDISSFQIGIYFLELNTSNGIFREKIIKN